VLTEHELRTRALAIMAAVADGRHTDVDPLIADLHPEDVGTLVSGLASLAVSSIIPWSRMGDPAALARVAEVLRGGLLERALADPGGSDAERG
jgi:hypothetical protein